MPIARAHPYNNICRYANADGDPLSTIYLSRNQPNHLPLVGGQFGENTVGELILIREADRI